MQFFLFTSSMLALAGAGIVSAQLPSVSAACTAALEGIAGSPDAACLNPSALVSIALTGGDTSIVQPVDKWLSGLCSSAPCSNSSLAAIATNATNGCSTELNALGISLTPQEVQQVYPVARQILCLKDNNKGGELCLTETLTTAQSLLGTLSVNNLPNIVLGIAFGQSNISTKSFCTDCVKEAYNILKSNFPQDVTAEDDQETSQICGASFIDGTHPTGISEAISSKKSSAAAASSYYVPAIVMTGAVTVAFSTAFALLV